MNQLLLNYNKYKKITWTIEALRAFNLIKSEISKCTTMHFLSDTDPIYLHTDASDYGVGAYLFQLVDGQETPIAFVSKSLNKAQLRWAVIQKEAYAIFYSCTYLKSLLRDRTFTLRTDHRNLLYIKDNSNPMIVRWFMALSEYSFKIEYIPGANNDIADSMSRLCRNNMVDFPQEYTPDAIMSANTIEKFKLTRDQYNTISKVHNSQVGHFGLERTLKRLIDKKIVWQYMRQHVRWFIDHCSCCQKMSMLKVPIHAHGFSTSTYTPMECLNIDFIGPFPDGGYVLVIIDTFTRWVELFHTEDATALSTAKCLLQHFGRFGAPLQLRSDNGPHFISEVIREFLTLIGTQHCLTLAYSKEENAIVERMNKEVNRHLRALTFDNVTLEDYKTSLPFVQRILNSNHSDRLKISSSQLRFIFQKLAACGQPILELQRCDFLRCGTCHLFPVQKVIDSYLTAHPHTANQTFHNLVAHITLHSPNFSQSAEDMGYTASATHTTPLQSFDISSTVATLLNSPTFIAALATAAAAAVVPPPPRSARPPRTGRGSQRGQPKTSNPPATDPPRSYCYAHGYDAHSSADCYKMRWSSLAKTFTDEARLATNHTSFPGGSILR